MCKKKSIFALSIFVAILVLVVIAKTASFYPFLFQLIFEKEVKLKQAEPSKLNILILGIGGGRHDGPNLTDTIILANINEGKNKVTLASIPRDLWIPDLDGYNKKINEAYAKGELKKKGGGITLAEAVVEKVTGQSVDYAVRIDFNGFVRAVDVVGGLEIVVDNTLDDYRYPISGKEDDSCGFSEEDIKQFIATVSAETEISDKFSCRYKHLYFEKGSQHLDGEQSLEFVRSRHGINGEGSDFARSKRQQKIITAFKDKIFSAQTLVNPARIINLYNIVKDSIDTNIKQDEFDDFIRLAQKMRQAKITSFVIDTGDQTKQRQGLLDEAPYTNEYNFLSVLIPRVGNGDFSEIHQFIECQLNGGNCPLTSKSKN